MTAVVVPPLAASRTGRARDPVAETATAPPRPPPTLNVRRSIISRGGGFEPPRSIPPQRRSSSSRTCTRRARGATATATLGDLTHAERRPRVRRRGLHLTACRDLEDRAIAGEQIEADLRGERQQVERRRRQH